MVIQTQWKTIEGYPDYEVSNTGQVRNKKSGKTLKPPKNTSGYLQVFLYNNGRRKKKCVHRLVAEAFIDNPNPEEFDQVNHKNSCRTDNRVENLEWCSNAYNQRHMVANGHSTLAKLDYKQASEIRELLLLGAKVGRLAKRYGVSRHMISQIKAGKTWSWVDDASEYLYKPEQDTDNE